MMRSIVWSHGLVIPASNVTSPDSSRQREIGWPGPSRMAHEAASPREIVTMGRDRSSSAWSRCQPSAASGSYQLMIAESHVYFVVSVIRTNPRNSNRLTIRYCAGTTHACPLALIRSTSARSLDVMASTSLPRPRGRAPRPRRPDCLGAPPRAGPSPKRSPRPSSRARGQTWPFATCPVEAG